MKEWILLGDIEGIMYTFELTFHILNPDSSDI